MKLWMYSVLRIIMVLDGHSMHGFLQISVLLMRFGITLNSVLKIWQVMLLMVPFSCTNESLNVSERETNAYLEGSPYANILYDSVWAIACALNRSLSILQERNFSLSSVNIRTNQSHARNDIMDVLEEQLSQFSFQGSSGPLNSLILMVPRCIW